MIRALVAAVAGLASSPDESFVSLETRDVIFTGDIVYVDRLPGKGPARDTDSWIAVFEAMAAFGPTHVVRRCGRSTRQHSKFLRRKVWSGQMPGPDGSAG